MFPKIYQKFEFSDSQQHDGATVAAVIGLKIRIAVQTNFSDASERIAASRCGNEAFSKPNPAMLREINRELGQQLSKTLMIGDTSHDLLMAYNGGVLPLEEMKSHSPLCNSFYQATLGLAVLHSKLKILKSVFL